MATLRRFNVAGPCIEQGEIVRETAQFYVYKYRSTPTSFAVSRMKKDGGNLVHTVPCESCVDHPNSQYPNGYQD